MTTSAWSNERTDAAQTSTNGAGTRASGPNAATDNTVVDGEVVDGELVETNENGAGDAAPDPADIVDAELVDDLIDDDTNGAPDSATVPAPPIYPTTAGPVDSGSFPVVPGPADGLGTDVDPRSDFNARETTEVEAITKAPTSDAIATEGDAAPDATDVSEPDATAVVDTAANAGTENEPSADDPPPAETTAGATSRRPASSNRPARDPDRLLPPSGTTRPRRLAAPGPFLEDEPAATSFASSPPASDALVADTPPAPRIAASTAAAAQAATPPATPTDDEVEPIDDEVEPINGGVEPIDDEVAPTDDEVDEVVVAEGVTEAALVDDAVEAVEDLDPSVDVDPSLDADVDVETDDEPVGDAVIDAARAGGVDEFVPDADAVDDEGVIAEPPANRPMLQLRQIAGLTAGTIMDLQERSYDFADRDDSVGFSVLIDDYDRAVIVPGSAEASIDGEPIDEPTVLGSAVLDVGTARFTIQPVKDRPKASDWVDAHAFEDGDDNPLIEVPAELAEIPPEKTSKRRGLLRRKNKVDDDAQTDVVTWEFTEAVRQTRIEIATRKRFSHPDPAELAIRAECAAPILGTRPPGHPEFAQFAAMSADVPWLPNFSDINAIPSDLGFQIQPLLALPSVPVVVDLTNGPFGIVGTPSAAEACARQVVLALRAMSTDELQIHLAPEWEDLESWTWAEELVEQGPLQLPDEDDGTYPVALLDTSCQYGNGFTHEDAISGDLGVVILAPEIEDLPPYCATVLQIDPTGRALLTNQHGQVIRGTPIGVPISAARDVAQDLIDLADQRRH
ncbi:MAG: hypothetical protein AAF467_23475 [Actinomycetota bacterium]